MNSKIQWNSAIKEVHIQDSHQNNWKIALHSKEGHTFAVLFFKFYFILFYFALLTILLYIQYRRPPYFFEIFKTLYWIKEKSTNNICTARRNLIMSIAKSQILPTHWKPQSYFSLSLFSNHHIMVTTILSSLPIDSWCLFLNFIWMESFSMCFCRSDFLTVCLWKLPMLFCTARVCENFKLWIYHNIFTHYTVDGH